jgi:SAM-dependent methyltransferase
VGSGARRAAGRAGPAHAAEYFRRTHEYLDGDYQSARPLAHRYADLLLDGMRPDDVVVELGCGTGRRIAPRIAGHCRYVGVDRVADRLTAAVANSTGTRFVRGDIAGLPLAPASVSGVLSFYAMIHVPAARLPADLAAIRRCLRPGGKFVGSIGTACSAWARQPPESVSCVPYPALRGLLERAGFTLADSEVSASPAMDVAFCWFCAIASAGPR